MFNKQFNRLAFCTSVTLAVTALQSVAAAARDRIQIVGSSTVYPFSTIVAGRFGNRGKFKTPVIESAGTGGGMKLFCRGIGSGHPDISNASRSMKSSEREDCRKNGVSDVIEMAFGNDGIAFANNINSRKLNLTRRQLWLAPAEHGPKPRKWSEIDPALPDSRITVLVPPPTSGTRDAWNSLVMKKGCPEEVRYRGKNACKVLREDGAVVEAGENDTLIVQELEANPDAFWIFGFSYLENNGDRIQAATIVGFKQAARHLPVHFSHSQGDGSPERQPHRDGEQDRGAAECRLPGSGAPG